MLTCHAQTLAATKTRGRNKNTESQRCRPEFMPVPRRLSLAASCPRQFDPARQATFSSRHLPFAALKFKRKPRGSYRPQGVVSREARLRMRRDIYPPDPARTRTNTRHRKQGRLLDKRTAFRHRIDRDEKTAQRCRKHVRRSTPPPPVSTGRGCNVAAGNRGPKRGHKSLPAAAPARKS